MPIAVQKAGIIYQIFKTYGDTIEGRTRATEALRALLRFYYGEGYQYNFYGTSVENGLITKAFVDRYNQLRSLSVTVPNAMAQIEASGSVSISFVQRENPVYIYPTYYEYRIRPYSIIDRHEFLPLSLQKLKYIGCKLRGTGINSNSTETTDGGPVVKITRVNQNQIIFSNNSITTARANTSGLPVRQLTSRDISSGTGRVSETVTSIQQS